MLFLYTAWFCESDRSSEESASEWSSCLLIDAESDYDGRVWGDHLADRRAGQAASLKFLRSTVEKAESWPQKKIEKVSRVKFGQEPPANQIGW